jgi:hypothetical protein
MAKPHFVSKRALLDSALRAFKAQDPVATLKIVLTEIEGILQEAHRVSTGRPAKLKRLLAFAKESATAKAGAEDTLLFPGAFARYLEAYTFANFEPEVGGDAGSRHAVGHGAASADSYTMVRALQAILTLDQLAFYT